MDSVITDTLAVAAGMSQSVERGFWEVFFDHGSSYLLILAAGYAIVRITTFCINLKNGVNNNKEDIKGVVDRIDESFKELGKTNEKLYSQLSETKEKISTVSERVKNMTKDIKKLDKKITTVEAKTNTDSWQDLVGKIRDNSTVTINSPMSLNEKGKDLSEALGAEEWAESIAGPLLAEERSKEDFDLEFCALNYVANRLTGQIEKVIYKASLEKGVSIYDSLGVLVVVLQDKLRERIRD